MNIRYDALHCMQPTCMCAFRHTTDRRFRFVLLLTMINNHDLPLDVSASLLPDGLLRLSEKAVI